MAQMKLSHTILKSVSIRVLIVIIISSVISYLHLYNSTENNIQDSLQKYVGERAKREEALFLLAESNQQLLKEETIKRFKQKPTKEELLKFDKLLKLYPDGTIRNRKELYDGKESAGVFIPPGLKMTAELKHRIVIMKELIENYGKAFRNRFKDTYFITPENIVVLYWPDTPNWTMDLPADFDLQKEEYSWGSNVVNNPSRKPVWTGAFYDDVSKTWMSSAVTPIDGPGWSVTAGHDVMLDEFVARVSNEHMKGTYNMIFRKDGRIIAHPKLLTTIENGKGVLNLKTVNDHYLKQIFDTVMADKDPIDNTPKIISRSDLKDVIVYNKIGGPEWYFVTVLPRSLITANALSGIIFIIVLALASLALQIAFLYYGLKREVIEPLRSLEESVKRISKGVYQSRVETERTDEIGQLAHSFNTMAQTIQNNEQSLLDKVEERTKQIDDQKAILIQKSKLASLGQMAGGIAHEINTPLSIINMKLDQALDRISEKDYSEEYMIDSINVVLKTTDRIAKIVRGLKFFAREGTNLPKHNVLMDSIIDNTMGLCSEKMAQDKIHFEIIKNYESTMTIDCRPVEISQVMLNLLNNSHDAIMEKPDRWIKLTVSDLGESVEISVTDCGAGIPGDIQDKILQPFFTTKEVGKGTGLGLSISHGIVQAHSGKFFIDNTSVNTKFTFVIPKVDTLEEQKQVS